MFRISSQTQRKFNQKYLAQRHCTKDHKYHGGVKSKEVIGYF